MKGPIHGKPHKPIKKIPDIPIYEEGMFKENKTSPLLEKVLEIHNSKINHDLSRINSNIEKINEKILDVAEHGYAILCIHFKKYGETYCCDTTTTAISNKFSNSYEYYIHTDLSKNRIIERIKSYYKDEGFDAEIVSPPYNDNYIEIRWDRKIKIK